MIQKLFTLARKNLIECGIDDPVRAVARLFENEGVGSALVKQGGEYVSIITDSMIFNAISENRDVREMRVRDFKLMPLVKVGRDADYEEVMESFEKNGVSRIALTDELGKVVGVLKRKNLERFGFFYKASKSSSLKR
ncbi:MAG: CBS domain-containing protein [Candidatus Altiarchaeota archaeon]|nr:CBS domain-containing protein [Candidatus Altiarchaeota archaeon]